MAYPVLFLALAYAGGILAAHNTALPSVSWAICVCLALGLTWIRYGQRQSSAKVMCSLLLTLFFLGAGVTRHQDRIYRQNPLTRLPGKDYLEVIGQLTRSPERRPDRDLLYIRTSNVHYLNQDLRVRGNLRISVPHSPYVKLPGDLLLGDRLRIAVRLLRFPGNRNFESTHPKKRYQVQNLHRLAVCKSPWLVQRLSRGNAWSLSRKVSGLRQRLLSTIRKRFSNRETGALAPEGAVLEALLLGERSRLDADTIRSFQTSGLYHLLAISGAHVAILVAVLTWLLSRLRRLGYSTWIFLLLLLMFFVLLVEGRPSVVRAASMAALYLTGKTFWKDVSPLNTLALSAFGLLFLRALRLFDLGFQLTFAATLSILLFYPRIVRLLPRLPLRTQSVLSITLAAQLGVLPITVQAFNRVTFLPLLFNLIALPLVAGIMVYGYVFLALSALFSRLGGLVAGPLRIFLRGLLTLAESGDAIPLAAYRLPGPGPLVILAYLLFLGGWLLPRHLKRTRIFVGVGFAISLSLLILPIPRPPHSGVTVSFIDVGHGDAILVRLPGRDTLLIDAGGQRQGNFDIGERVVSPYLWRRGVREVNTLVMTHPHPDHCQGMQAVLRSFRVREFWTSGAFYPLRAPSWLESMLPGDCRRHFLFRGDIREREGVRIEVLHPGKGEPGRQPDANHYSLALRLVYGETALMLTADIDAAAEREILSGSLVLESGVLKSPHHGSRTSSSTDFLQAVSPGMVVISTGRGRQGLPASQVLERYRRQGAIVYRTDVHGAVEVHSDGRMFSVRTAVPLPPYKAAAAWARSGRLPNENI
jgi:competence protein ComEC